MTATEQLNVRLRTGEKAMLAEAARTHALSVSAYIRQQLFGATPAPDADQTLIQGLAVLKPRFEAALAQIDANMQAIATLKQQPDMPARPAETTPAPSAAPYPPYQQRAPLIVAQKVAQKITQQQETGFADSPPKPHGSSL